MTESPIVNEWIEQASNERELKRMQSAVTRVLNARFPNQVPGEVATTIKQQPSLEVLNDWIDQAAVLSFDDFLAYLRR